jgi:hypothetical protein
LTDSDPAIVVEAPAGVPVDDRADNVTTIRPLPGPPDDGDPVHVLLTAPAELMTDEGRRWVAAAAERAARGAARLEVRLERAPRIDAGMLASLTEIGRRAGLSHIRLLVHRGG